MMLTRLLPIVLLAGPLGAADIKSEIAKVAEALNRAAVAHDSDAYTNLLTADFHAITGAGIIRDRQAMSTFIKGGPSVPADLKREEVSTAVYGDAVIQITKELWTRSGGAKVESRVSTVFVRQGGEWKLALRMSTPVAQ